MRKQLCFCNMRKQKKISAVLHTLNLRLLFLKGKHSCEEIAFNVVFFYLVENKELRREFLLYLISLKILLANYLALSVSWVSKCSVER